MVNVDKNLEKQLALVRQHTIFEVISGSTAYGMATPQSDVDIKGICLIPDLKLYFGCQGFEQQDGGWTDEQGNHQDKVIYHLPKFMKLAGDNNPNFIELLWTDKEHILRITPEGQRLRDNRKLFLCKRAKHSFSGYAISQLKRIEAHKRWIDNPPSKPTREQFTHTKRITVGPLGTTFSEGTKFKRLISREINDKGEEWLEFEVEVYDASGYDHAKKEWDHYSQWRENRNEKRAELEAKHSYDTKHAAHLVRLLRMGYEILSTGEVLVKRPDAAELLSIRNGAWTYQQIIEYAREMDAKLEDIYEKSTLPHTPPLDKIEELQMELIESSLRRAGALK